MIGPLSSGKHMTQLNRRVVFAGILLVLRVTGGVRAADGPHVSLQILADRTAGAPGENANLALVATIEDGWHIYWKNPGPAAGLPTTIDWKVPPGVEIGPTMFPVPHVETD